MSAEEIVRSGELRAQFLKQFGDPETRTLVNFLCIVDEFKFLEGTSLTSNALLTQKKESSAMTHPHATQKLPFQSFLFSSYPWAVTPPCPTLAGSSLTPSPSLVHFFLFSSEEGK